MSPVRTTRILHADPAGIEAAADVLRRGGLVAFPTETVYGLGADATNGRAVASLYEAKGRPRFNPLIVHVATIDAARRLGVFEAQAEQLAAAFWPGPLTLVLPKREGCPVSDLALAGLDSVALRVPAHLVARALIERAGRAIVAPSANRSGHVSATSADHVAQDLSGCIDAILDGGPSEIGLESTIVACRAGTARILRPGGISRQAIAAILGKLDAAPASLGESKPRAPGLLASHYAPRARVRIDAAEVKPGEAWLGFGAARPAGAAPVAAQNLSPAGDLAEAAANLFTMLRKLDRTGAPTIAVAPIPADGLGEAIRDRLSRAAADR